MDVLSFFASPIVRDIGAVGLLVLVVLMVLTGRLIPKTTHDRELAAADKRAADAIDRGNEWKTTAEETARVNTVVREQNSKLIESAQVFKDFLRSAGPAFGDTQPPGGGS